MIKFHPNLKRFHDKEREEAFRGCACQRVQHILGALHMVHIQVKAMGRWNPIKITTSSYVFMFSTPVHSGSRKLQRRENCWTSTLLKASWGFVLFWKPFNFVMLSPAPFCYFPRYFHDSLNWARVIIPMTRVISRMTCWTPGILRIPSAVRPSLVLRLGLHPDGVHTGLLKNIKQFWCLLFIV